MVFEFLIIMKIKLIIIIGLATLLLVGCHTAKVENNWNKTPTVNSNIVNSVGFDNNIYMDKNTVIVFPYSLSF